MTARTELERDAVIVACAISAGIHAALTPAHFAEGLGAGIGFLVATVLLAGLAVTLTRQDGTALWFLTSLALAGLIASYLLAVTSGLPVLNPQPERVQGLAVATKIVEVVGLALAIDLLRHGRPAAAFHISPKGTMT
jgi:hypothetical protein